MVVPGRRPLTCMAFLLGALWLLLGCASASPPPTPTPGAAPVAGEQVLTLWHALPEAQAAVLQGLADEWATQQAGSVRVRLEGSPDEESLHQKLLAAIQTEMPPSLAFVRPPDIAAYADADALLPLDPLVVAADAAEDEDLYAQFFESVRYPKADDALYAWPTHRYQTLFFLNRSRAEALGGPVPPPTWEALVQLCARHMEEGGQSCFAAFPTGSVAVLWVWNHGGEIVDVAAALPLFQGEAGQAVMRWLGALRAVDGVYLAPSYQAQREAFVSGQTLFAFDSTAAIPDYEARINSAFDMMVLPPPTTTAAPVTVATGGNVAIFRADPTTEALAWSFLQEWTDTEANYRWAAALDAYPVRRSALAALDAQWPDFSRQRQAAAWLPYARSEPLLASWPQIEQALAQAMIETINGEEDPAAALTEAARKAQALLDP